MTAVGKELLFLFLGWLLGIASPIIVDSLKRRKEEREFRTAVKTELSELQYRLAVAAFQIYLRLGLINREVLTWLRPIVANYEGLNRSEGLLKAIDGFLKLPDGQINLVAALDKAKDGHTIGLKKYIAPILDAKLVFASFDDELLRRLSEVRVHLNLFNDEVEQARHFFQLTFTLKSDVNHPRAVQALENTQRHAAERARVVVDHISEIKWL